MNTKFLKRLLVLFLILMLLPLSGCVSSDEGNETDSGYSVDEGMAESSSESGAGNSEEAGTYGTIQGNILFESLETPVESATVYIRLNDVSLADAPSTVIAETSIEGVSVGLEGEGSIPYTLGFPELVDNRSYSLYVHVDVDGDGSVSKGDYVTTWHNDVPAGQEEVLLDVTVSQV
ncbi:YbaY family lipoprotein [Methanosarcina sp. KYL-1]|uniref:YbaY family lipoprotein n=1 Tax=Methanosarcina sp. KYL-1 TaxID=2602068 RepID=UPI002100B2EB|nr:YbaY family lipoprotein [Methanosarcina sp. KYL-1]